jgi:hypothetical protein
MPIKPHSHHMQLNNRCFTAIQPHVLQCGGIPVVIADKGKSAMKMDPTNSIPFYMPPELI